MPPQEIKSFSEVSICEAAARRVPTELRIEPVTEGTEGTLASQILAVRDCREVLISRPQTRKREGVFLPVGWPLTLHFQLGGLWLRAKTVVIGHEHYRLYPTRRVDAVRLEMPEHVAVAERRKEIRTSSSNSSMVLGALWSLTGSDGDGAGLSEVGRIFDRSPSGLSLRFARPPRVEEGEYVAVRIDSGLGRECLVMRGQVARLCQESDGSWTVGLEVLRYLRPGEAPKLTEHLANHGIDDTGSGEAP